MGRLKKNDIEGQKLIEERKNICKNLGISYGAYMARLRRGWSQEEADNMPKVENACRFYKGQSARSYVKEHGGSIGLYNYYVNFLPIEEAVDRAIHKKGQVKYYREGISLRQWCIKNGKNYANEYKKLWLINHLEEK